MGTAVFARYQIDISAGACRRSPERLQDLQGIRQVIGLSRRLRLAPAMCPEYRIHKAQLLAVMDSGAGSMLVSGNQRLWLLPDCDCQFHRSVGSTSVDRTCAQVCYGVYLGGDILAYRIQIARDVFHVTQALMPQFQYEFWHEFFGLHRSSVGLTSLCHSSSNGGVKGFHPTVLEALRSYADARRLIWEEYLPDIEFAYNSLPDDSTGCPPLRLSLGQEARSPLGSLFTEGGGVG